MSGAATRRWPSAPTLVELHTAGRAPPHRWSSLSRPPPVERFPLVELVETTPCRQVVSTRLLATLAAGSTSGKGRAFPASRAATAGRACRDHRQPSNTRWSSLSRPLPRGQVVSTRQLATLAASSTSGGVEPPPLAELVETTPPRKWFRLGSSLRSRPAQPAERVERPRWSSLSRPPLTSSRGSPGTRCCRSSPPRRSPVTVG